MKYILGDFSELYLPNTIVFLPVNPPIQFSDLYVEHIEWKSRLISKSFDQLSEKEENMELKFIQI